MDMTEEFWLYIPNTCHTYQASNLGRIRRLIKTEAGMVAKILTTSTNNYGYLTVMVYHQIAVHRLIAQAFSLGIPKGHHVHHIDGNKQNNRLDNLRIMSHGEHLYLHARQRREEKYYKSIA